MRGASKGSPRSNIPSHWGSLAALEAAGGCGASQAVDPSLSSRRRCFPGRGGEGRGCETQRWPPSQALNVIPSQSHGWKRLEVPVLVWGFEIKNYKWVQAKGPQPEGVGVRPCGNWGLSQGDVAPLLCVQGALECCITGSARAEAMES